MTNKDASDDPKGGADDSKTSVLPRSGLARDILEHLGTSEI